MDPEAALQGAQRALDRKDYEDAAEYLSNYWGWRDRRGFEPERGDERARAMAKRLPLGRAVPPIGAWDMHAGGTAALEGTHGYGLTTPYGNYKIDAPHRRGHGYAVRFENVRGARGGGLHKWLDGRGVEHAQPIHDRARSPAQAATWARRHYKDHFRKAKANGSPRGPRPKSGKAKRNGKTKETKRKPGSVLGAALRRDK